MPVRWSTLIAEPDGRISLHRVRKFSAILMGWLALPVLLYGVLTDAPLDALALVAAVLVAPMTGGQVADAIYGKFHSDRIQQGAARGRRSTD